MTILASTTPRRVLLATDLGPDGDRALERALQICEAWKARLVVLHVRQSEAADLTEAPSRWLCESDPISEIRRLLRLEIGEAADDVDVLLADGDAAKVIDETAETTGCDLIVMGAARRKAFSVLELGKTLDRVLRRTTTPILIVRRRTHGPYRQAVFATDLSEASKATHDEAAKLFPEPIYSYLHAFDAPMAGLVDQKDEVIADARAAATSQLEAFVQHLPTQRQGGVPALVVKHGSPARTLCEYAASVSADLTVLTASSRGAVAELFLGSVVKDALECLTSDVLLAPERAS